MGYLVLRYWNHDVLSNTDGVLEDILSTMDQQRYEPPHPSPLPKRGEGVGRARRKA
jgi:lysyl-tRNA synthetase class 2